MRGKWSPALAAFLLAAAACSPQCGTRATPVAATSPASSPAPSPSPTPTAPLQISAATFHAGEVGVAYAAVPLAATGGVQPYTWSVASGALPDGVTLGSDGAVSGSPTSAGQFSFTIEATDAKGGTASVPGTIGVAGALSAGLIPACAQYCRVELGCASVCGAFGHVSGGVGPYGYQLTDGALPAGTSLSGLSLDGTFKGLPGWLQFTVQVSDPRGGTATVSPRFWMYDHLSLSGGACGPSRGSCTVTLSYTGGTPGEQVTAAPTAWVGANCGFTAVFPCPEPTFGAAYKPGAVILTLTYQANYPATFGTMTVQLTSTDLCGPGVQCSAAASVSVQG